MKPKDALRQAGFPVKEGKGRLSREAIAKIHELVASGVVVDGYTVSTPATEEAPAEIKKGKTPGAKEVVELAPMRYDEGEWKAVSAVPIFGRTEHSMREVCTFCGVSLVAHVCDEPFVLGVRVDVVRR